MILWLTGLFSATDWGTKAENNPGPHGFSEIMYQFSSASANNGSALMGSSYLRGLTITRIPSPTAVQWDIAAALVIIISRFLPIIAPIAMAASLGAKKAVPFG